MKKTFLQEKGEEGFTLVEVLIATLILLIVVIAFTNLFTTSYLGITGSGERSETLFELQKHLEQEAEQNYGSAIHVGAKEIVFNNNGVTVPGGHGSFSMDFDDGKEVVIDVFIYAPEQE